jgi:hypothetical protein
MSGYGYYDEEGSGLLSSIIGGGNEGGLYTGGGTRSFAVARTGVPGRAAYVQKGYYAPRLPALQWGIRRVLRQVINEHNPSDRKRDWMNIARKKMLEAKQEYFKSLSPTEKEAYINRQARVQAQKERKREKVALIRKKLESLRGQTMDETANNIRNALIMEGATKARLLRSALKILYPKELLPKKEDEKRQVREMLKKYNFAGARKPPRPMSSLDASRAFGRIPPELIEAKKQLILKSLTSPPEEEAPAPPPTSESKGEPKKKQTR